MTAPAITKPLLLNRLVVFVGPYLAIGSGALAAWLAHHLPGLHLQQQGTAAVITTAAEFLGGVLVTWALQQKWLDGWQKWEQAMIRITDQVVPDQLHSGPAAAIHTVPTVPTGSAELATAVTETVLRPSAPLAAPMGLPAVDGITLLPPS